MSSKLKTIVPVHCTASLSQTVDSKDISNPLMAVDFPKIQYSNTSSIHKWFGKNVYDYEIEVEDGYNNINPWQIIKHYYPEDWYFVPTDFSKPQEYYHNILIDTGSVKIKHTFDPKHKNVISYSSIQIKRVIHPKDWPVSSLSTPVRFKVLHKHNTTYNYFDYKEAWEKVFCIQNRTTTHSWLVYFDQHIRTDLKIPNWFKKWWQSRGISEEIIPPDIISLYHYFKSHYKPNPGEVHIPSLMYYCMTFFTPWVYQWYFDYQYVPGTQIPMLVKRHKFKWWGSFKNTTTELKISQWIRTKITKSSMPALTYANTLAIPDNPTFGIQKAQCQARLAAAKTPEEYKLICQEMFQHLSTSSEFPVNPSSSKPRGVSSGQSSSKTSHKGKNKCISSSSSSSAVSLSSFEDSDEDDIMPAIKIKSKADKKAKARKEKLKQKEKRKEKIKRKEKKKKDTSPSSSCSDSL
ncbi:hypothetical protein JCGZ_13670 [Jatropha curcas]|uniref:Uncharacterized protein n=1 Tax=Jatropha curcas TaxID=180498 RepID=A0A067K987_JATCU|nr:hypothetical protein JCGZ_13670 [Jatropha curcas]